MPIHSWHQGKDVIEILINIQSVSFRTFHKTVDGRAGFGSFWCIRKQPVAVDNRKWTDGVFDPVVGDFATAISQIIFQIRFLVQCIGYCFTQLRFRQYIYNESSHAQKASKTGFSSSRRILCRSTAVLSASSASLSNTLLQYCNPFSAVVEVSPGLFT